MAPDPDTLAERAALELGGREELSIGCRVHEMPLSECPCPKGEGNWLEYRALWVLARREAERNADTINLMRKQAGEDHDTIEQLRARTPQLLDVVDQGQAQIVLLALAELELRRPGWHYAIAEIADLFGGAPAQQMLQQFTKTSADEIKSFIALRDELRDWVNSGMPLPTTQKVVTDIVNKLDDIILEREAKFRGG